MIATRSLGPEVTDDESAKTKPQTNLNRQPIRRSKGKKGWMVSDEMHAFFADSFTDGLLEDVDYIPEAPRMACIAGYPSTGEALGTVVSKSERVISFIPPTHIRMPADVVTTKKVVYDPWRKVFHVKGEPSNLVHHSDYLLLRRDGTSIAGWCE